LPSLLQAQCTPERGRGENGDGKRATGAGSN
jgi:hypothetical protein